MSFTTNTSNLSGKSTTNAFDIVANSLTVNKNTLCKGDLTVLGTTNIGSVTLENGFVNNLTVNNFTATNPVPITSGGTGLATLGAPNQVLTVNPAGTSLIYQAPGLNNPVTITGTGFTGNPTLSLGLEPDTGSLGRGFIRTGLAATSGLLLGTVNATVLRLWSNFSTDSNAEIINSNANFTYNSTGTSGVFQVINGGGGISFTNSGIGTISLATAGGVITLADPTSLSGAVNISTGGGIFNLSTGAGSTNITTVAGNLSLTTGIGALSLTTGAGNISLTTVGAGIISLLTATAGAINIGTTVGLVNLYGSAVTIGSPVIYIGTGSAVPIPSILTFACGAVTGITGAWTITTLGFQLNALSISLNSTGTIALNNNTTVSGTCSVSGNLFANSANAADVTNISPGVFVFDNGSGNAYGMDLGYNATTTRYRTRIFAPIIGGGGDIALSTGNRTGLQSAYTDRIIVRGDTGNIQMTSPTTISANFNVTTGNIFASQNIVAAVTILNNGDLALSSSSPGSILIRGGSGSIITLPDATTLIIGYSYTINNNSSSTATINQHNSGSVGVVAPGNMATVTCIATSSPNGQWDLHVSGLAPNTDWANPGAIGSTTPNTGVFTTLTAATCNVSGNLFGNSTNAVDSTNTNPGIFVFNNGLGDAYGIDLGYNATSARYRTRMFSPIAGGGGDIALSTGNRTTGLQSAYTDRIIVRGDTGNVQIIAPITSVTGTSTTLNSGVLQVTNSSTTITSNIAQFLQPTLGDIGVLTEDLNITFGKSHSVNNCAQLRFGHTLNITPYSNPFTTWGFYGLSGTNIQLRLNPPVGGPKNVTITGNTEIVGDLNITGTVQVKNSSTFYINSANFFATQLAWTDAQNILTSRSVGVNTLTTTSTGFRNDNSYALQVSVSFSCKRGGTNSAGNNTIRIAYNTVNDFLADQEFTGLEVASVSANFPLLPNEKVRCLINPVNATPVEFQAVCITINTTPII